jgi:putative transposase
MKTYRYKLYTKAKDGILDNQIDRFGIVYNHCIALHKRYFKFTGKYLNKYQLMAHIAKISHRSRWEEIFNGLPSLAVQNVAERIDKAYRLFFRNLKHKVRTSPPSFKKVKKYSSYTLKQCGYKFNENKIRLNGRWYGFFKSQEIKGKVKTVTVKRDRCGDLWIVVITDKIDVMEYPKSGNSVGYDFGMKTFLTGSDGIDHVAPLFLKQSKAVNEKLSRAISSKQKGSNNRKNAVVAKARFMRHLANQRADFQWKLANRIVEKYDVICFENLNLKGISARFGKKVGEYGFGEFLNKIQYLASKHGKEVRFVGRFFPSSKLCHCCGYKNDGLRLRDREWTCPECGTHHDRDRNASVNILLEGTSSSWIDTIRPSETTAVVA